MNFTRNFAIIAICFLFVISSFITPSLATNQGPDDYPNGSYSTLGGHFEDMLITQENPETEINFNADF